MAKSAAAGDSPGEDSGERVRAMAGAIYRTESRRVFATLVRLLGDFDGPAEVEDFFNVVIRQVEDALCVHTSSVLRDGSR